MKAVNDPKRDFLIDQNQEDPTSLVNLLKQTDFCINSQNRQRIAYENVLDELTLSEDNDDMDSFSRSMLNSISHEPQPQSTTTHKLQGPPHKKFANSDSSLSSIHTDKHQEGV